MEYDVINIVHKLNNGTLKSVHLDGLMKIPKDTCQYVMQIPYEERCAFVYNTHDCAVANAPLVNPFSWVFCEYPEEWSFIGVLFLFFTLIILFYLTSILADVFVCPNLEVIADTLNLPESLAGVTILAFGNGAPDLFSAYAGAEMDHPEIVFASLTGSGLFVTTFVSGLILFTRPFKVDKLGLLRNVFFYLVTYTILFLCFYCRYYTLTHALCILGVYVIYIGINIAHVVADNLLKKKKERMRIADEEKLKKMARERSLFIPNRKNRASMAEGIIFRKEANRVYSLMGFELSVPRYFRGYNWNHFRPLIEEFREEISLEKIIGPDPPVFRKIIMIIEVPILIGLKLIVPLVNCDERNDGWCKLLVMINFFLFPILVLYCFDYDEITVSAGQVSVGIWFFGILVGILFATILFFITDTYSKPRFHWLLAYLGFVCAIAVIRFVSAQVIFHLSIIGARFTISSSILAITLLSWGNCLVDCVSNTALAKHGLQNMGFAACFGGPMFNCSLGVGAISIIVYLKGIPIQAFYGHVAPVGSLFLFISLLSTLIFIPSLNFEGRRFFGIYLIMLYITFMILCLLMEDTIHAFGTQYFKDRASADKE
ncbi:mitochondrial sodium/calcium exchanger protein-like [Halyomorpha halys]|uniref:mitochondrial sodium/calcium exchanger protein-like n=1 Tax=Halyomorpha halys TaxID=286706 RepID=UPI0006D4F56E|nr:putative sodium/calcium exchanger 7 [Halyomorpha halys]